MSRTSLVNGVGIGLISLSSLTFGGCDQSSASSAPSAPTLPKIPASDALKLGRAGDATFYLKEIEGRRFLIADGKSSLAMAPLASGNDDKDSSPIEHTFSVETVNGSVGDATLYVITFNGQKFLFGDGTESGELIEISR